MTGATRPFLARYGFAFLAVAGVVALVAIPEVGGGFLALLYFAVFAAAWYGGFGAGLFSTAIVTCLYLLVVLTSKRPMPPDRLASLTMYPIGGLAICLIMRSMERSRRRAGAVARAAAEQAERLRATLQSIGDAVIVADLEGRILSLNPVAEALTGWTQADAEGRPLVEVFRIIHEETRAVVGNPVERVLREGRVVGLANHTILLARDGSERPIDDSAAPIRDASGSIGGAILVFRDIGGRREAERRTVEAEARFRTFMDNSPFAAFIKDDIGRYVWGNATWAGQHPGGAESALGKTDHELWPRETARRFVEGDRAALDAPGTVEFIEESTNWDGVSSHWMAFKFAIPDTQGRRLVGGVAVDVTRRVAAEAAVRESEARYRMLFESNPHPMWVFDGETLAFLAVNAAAVESYGYSRDEFLSMKITDIRPAEDVARVLERIELYRTTSYLGESLWRHCKKDGSVIDVEIASHSINFEGRSARLVLAHDVTDRRLAEEALRISRERLDLALNGAQLGLWFSDLASGEISFNERARDHFGLDSGEPIRSEVFILRLHPDDRERTRAAIELAIREGVPYDIEYRVLIDDIRFRWVRAIGRTFGDEAGRPLRFDGISIDVTAAKEAEIQLIEAKETAVEANNAKNKFLAVLGHELRTPLTPVLASVSALLDQPAADSPDGPIWSAADVYETLKMIRRNVELETRLISDLLDVSKVERGLLRLVLERIDLHEAIRQAAEICRDEVLVSGLDLRLELQAGEHVVDADHARMMQIVWNMIHNAAKFSQTGGRLTIRSRNPGPGAGRIAVEFEDTGIGIDPDFLPRIFDPFEQGSTEARNRLGGLGLGLAISRSIAEAHGGRLTARSPGMGLGSTFLLELETADHFPTIGVEAPKPRPARRRLEAPKVLLVEDNVDTLRYLAVLLRHRGYDVQSAARVAEAATMADGSPFDVLVSDIELPDGSGLDLMRGLKGRLVGIAVSGFGSDSDVQLSLEAGFSYHLTKPVDFSRLEATIREAVAAPAG